MSVTVTIRMYRAGFGDCFVLRFEEGDQRRHVLIDCGVHHQDEEGKARMPAAVQDIASFTDYHLDLAVISHDHTDHVTGFEYAREQFEPISIDQLWLSWAEKETDTEAGQILDEYARNQEALKEVQKAAKKQGRDLSEYVRSRMVESDGLGWLRAKVGLKQTRFCEPGSQLSVPGIEGVRCYALAPPRCHELLARTSPYDPRGDMYGLAGMTAIAGSLWAAAANQLGTPPADGSGRDELGELAFPFGREHRRPAQWLEGGRIELGREEDATAVAAQTARYCEPGDEWRRIDAEWMGAAETLAMGVGSNKNNTSLVLAIELVESQQVLLFVGDAQIQNWQSWKDCPWEKSGLPADFTADLLSRVVLYKVGHHGSHNATAKKDGLELMTSPDLVALIPVDIKFANSQDWPHPADAVLAALQDKACDRVAEAKPLAGDPIVPTPTSRPLSHEGEDFASRLHAAKVQPDDLYLEYTVKG